MPHKTPQKFEPPPPLDWPAHAPGSGVRTLTEPPRVRGPPLLSWAEPWGSFKSLRPFYSFGVWGSIPNCISPCHSRQIQWNEPCSPTQCPHHRTPVPPKLSRFLLCAPNAVGQSARDDAACIRADEESQTDGDREGGGSGPGASTAWHHQSVTVESGAGGKSTMITIIQ